MIENTYAAGFEILMYLLFLHALRHAWRRGTAGVLRLITGIVYGIILEAATIHQLEAYHYGRFWIMVTPDVPLAIGVGWGIIVYGVRTYTQALDLPPWRRAVLNGLLALNIDLGMDVVAIRLGFWDWGQGLQFQYFGVPWANFWAWFWVVWGFTIVLEWVGEEGRRAWLAPPLALITGLSVVLGTNALIVFYLHPLGLANLAVALVLMGALLLTLQSRFWQRWKWTPDPLGARVAEAFHGYFLLVGLHSGALLHPPILLPLSLLMAALAEIVYRWIPGRWELKIRGKLEIEKKKA